MVVVVVVLVVGALAAVLVRSGGSDDAGDRRPSGAAGSGRSTFVADGPADVDAPAPEFSLPGLSGGSVDLAEYRGRPVVLNFWASWCNPCRREFPLLGEARAAHRKDRLEVIGVSYRDIAGDGRAFAESRGATWPLARDPDGKLAAVYGVRAIPQTFFIGPDGRIVSRVFGITSARDLEKEIGRILPER